MSKLFPSRFKLLFYFVKTYIILSTLIRLIFVFWVFKEVDTSFFKIANTFLIGLLFDVGTVSFFALPYALYLLLIPQRWHGSVFDRIVTWFAYSLGLVIFLFSFFAEITFWEEFKNRFNFIAVDYLIYTYEVVKNINESYPIPLLLSGILLITALLLFITKRKGIFQKTFTSESTFMDKLFPTLLVLGTVIIFALFVKNKDAEQFENRYNNEIAKTGIYSFFAAFQNNELSFTDFYKTLPVNEAFAEVKNKFRKRGHSLLFPEKELIYRNVPNTDSLPELKPNVIFICVESLSAKFLGSFGNTENITPTLDSLSNHSLFFTNLFATGTRTVRGMEAITLSIPPTPGRSIVKRQNNQQLFTIGEVFKKKGYTRNFFYGGDGYFDNMNSFFGGNGFDIVDRGRGFLMDASINTTRTNIEDDEVTFENAWGIADEDIYNKVIKVADDAHNTGKPFFDFVMTTSNHRPYTYPEGKIDIPSGSGRSGAVEYTDYAICAFLKKAQTKEWYKNTVIIIMADHCASSAGRQELDVKNYHIPGLMLNVPNTSSQKVNKMASQIDIFPTLFSLLNWNYDTNLYGTDILNMKPEEERAFVGTYRKLGLLKGDDKVMVLGDQKVSNFYQWDRESNELLPLKENEAFLKEIISNYQTADYLFTNDGLKLSTLEIEN
ncbi:MULTISPECIES: LTA synthase family protein [Aequorivita]|uniref:Sulfatase-like hydrolase/transferase n=1 Tax=Aequorivita iocasae TaxID=2803865 RepID=A0ABX7DSP2_9FLAO|nr:MULTISPECIES: alkaline phosphatase family protein [Aequorivita]QQX76840.1 sulfatase-like hydrolase/transferase [Aequorivita iocasae]UCA56312.1 sulfatase-like hydrolase/transferase [Aequorivita sp. F7]